MELKGADRSSTPVLWAATSPDDALVNTLGKCHPAGPEGLSGLLPTVPWVATREGQQIPTLAPLVRG